jgi:hypothetical protein
MSAKRLLLIVLVLALVAALSGGAYYYFRDRQGPDLTFAPAGGPVNGERTIGVSAEDPGSGLRSLSVTALRGEKSVTLAQKTAAGAPSSMNAEFSLAETGFSDGPVEIRVTATDASYYNLGKGNVSGESFSLVLDTRPPMLSVLSGAHNVNRGGSGLIAYEAGDDAAESGVRVGEHFFPGYKQDSGTHLAFFAFPYFMEPKDFEPVLVARDRAGNTAETGFRHHPRDRKFRKDSINISPGFLEAKMPQFRDDFPQADSDLEVFLKVNRELREQNRSEHYEFGKETADRPLWQNEFMRLPNSARMAAFGDHRTYYFDGKEVDQQVHLGVDLASVKADKVPAANAGRVLHAGDFGIYGRTVVIDHGLGLMSLYGHLRQIDVEQGDEIKRGRIIGRTGATGLAGGDHLHFGMYVSGMPVNPIEWWDPHWIQDNLADRIGM